MLRIDVDLGGISGSIGKTLGRYLDLEPALMEVGEYLLLSTRERFDDEVDPDGKPWQPLSPAYAARKAKSPTALRGILTFSGLLRDSIAYRVGPDYLEVGSAVKYAPIHQSGGGRVPKRAFLGLSAEDRDEIGRILQSMIGE